MGTGRTSTGDSDGSAHAIPQITSGASWRTILIDNEHLLIDAKDVGVPGTLKQFRADPATWSLSDITAANDELRARIQSHRDL